MNPAHIESVLLKEFAARRRKFWTVPVMLSLLPALFVAFLSVVGALVNAAGIPLDWIRGVRNIHYLPINFHRLDAIASVSGNAFNIALQIVVLFYLCRSLHDRDGRDEALFWKGIGLTPGEVITVRVLLCTVVLPLLAAVLTALVPTSLGLVDLIGQFVTGGGRPCKCHQSPRRDPHSRAPCLHGVSRPSPLAFPVLQLSPRCLRGQQGSRASGRLRPVGRADSHDRG